MEDSDNNGEQKRVVKYHQYHHDYDHDKLLII